MGECCSKENELEEKRTLRSFKTIKKENINDLNIINYEDKKEEIKNLYENTFDKLGQFQQLRVNFIKELRKEISNTNTIGNNNYQNYSGINNNNYIRIENNINIDDTQKKLYYIIIMTLILKSYLSKQYILNELQISLLELSIIIMYKKYENIELKLILFYLSKMFEILLINMHNIQNVLNLNEYLSKISIITENINLLTKEEKYPFIKTHIISLGEWFRNDYKIIIIQKDFRILLLKYYTYLFIQNFDFIIQNDENFKNNLCLNKNKIEYISDYYDENDLIQNENTINNNYLKKKEDLKKISLSIHYFFIICTEDIFTGKNIFYEFDNILQKEIVNNNLQNDINLIKFEKSIFHILFGNLLTNDYSTTMLFSFVDYIMEYQKFGIENTDTYHQMIINLYGRFNNNRIFLDKYSSFVSKLFIIEIEKFQKEKIILDELYLYINNINNKNNYNILDEGNLKIKNYENIYFFINLLKNISFYYIKQKNIKVFNDILIYLNSFIQRIRKDYQKKTININRTNNKYLYENINTAIKNYNLCKNDYYVQLNENTQMNLSNYFYSYIIMINDLCQIDYKNMTNDFDNSLIYTITIFEIKIIKHNKIKSIHQLVNLLNILIKHLNLKEINDYEEINHYLKNNLRLIKNQIYTLDNSYINNQFTTFHLNIIYIIIILILFNINKNKSYTQILILKHNKIILRINQFNKIIGSCFHLLSDLSKINANSIIFLLQRQIYSITHISFIKIIQIIQRELFNDENDVSFHHFRARTLYQDDKSSEMSININTKNDLYYNNRTHLLKDNFLINDTFSKYSNDTFSIRRKENNKFLHKLNTYNYNNDTFSEKIRVPVKDNYKYNYNDKLNMSNINTNDDIISEKNSSKNFEIKI